jgi:pimeloyl-ACP methyl ester carboxylesterase
MSVQYRSTAVSGVNVAYREAGDPAGPTLLLLHGFPASSFMYRHLMTALADRFHLVAPDYPGFGNSEAPDPDVWPYTFERLTDTVEALVDDLGLASYGLFLQDYGAPVGFRLALRRPDAIDFLVVQNGNAYEEGFTGVWDALRQALWHERTPETEEPLHAFLEPDGVRWIYTEGTRDPERISPTTGTSTSPSWSGRTGGGSTWISSTTTAPIRSSTRPGTSTCAVTGPRHWSCGAHVTPSSRRRAARRSCATCPMPSCTCSTPATSRSRTTGRRSPGW